MIRNVFVIIFLLIFSISDEVYATIYNASSWSQLKTYVESTADDGDTVTLAAGTYSASSTITIPNTKSITIEGAGVGSTEVDVGGTVPFVMRTSQGRITGILFDMTGEIAIRVSGTGWRIDHNEFNGQDSGTKADECISVSNSGVYYPTYGLGGLIDNNYFHDARVVIRGSGTSGSASANAYHSAPLALGTEDGVYIEDNTWLHEGEGYAGNVIDSNNSSSYIVRFNTFTKRGSGGGAIIHAHSAGDGASPRGSKKWEVYGNIIYQQTAYETMYLRGGTGVVFKNDIYDTGGEIHIRVLDARMFDSSGPIGLCNGNATSCANYDSCENAYGYVCRDQFGTGGDITAFDGSLPFPTQ